MTADLEDDIQISIEILLRQTSEKEIEGVGYLNIAIKSRARDSPKS
jgi:hypothetical protein